METDNLDIAAALGDTETEDTEVWNMNLYDQFTNLEGRINRLRYFLLTILFLIIGLVYAIIVGVVLAVLLIGMGLPEIIFDITFGLAMIPIVYVEYALTVKRLQDTGRGGGWITFSQAYAVLITLYLMAPIGSSVEGVLDITTAIMALPLGIVCLFFGGDTGPNQFGPDPLG
tara:strand:+ start:19 stop:534 length:516 start_codon:yes stop_codon:yes gene_type:complete